MTAYETTQILPRQGSGAQAATWDQPVALILVLVSGSPLVMSLGPEVIYIPLFATMLAASILRRTVFAHRDLLYMAAFFGIAIVHAASFGMGVIPASVGFLLKLAIALMTVRLTRDFTCAYVKVMSGLALLSLAFFLPHKVGFDLPGMLSSWNFGDPADGVNIGIHNFQWDPGRIRNSGIFWEPGAYAGYLLLAALFVVGSPRAVPWGRLALLVTAILTTESTMGYVALTVVAAMLVYKLRLRFDRYVRSILFPAFLAALLVGAVGAYNQLPFLREKVEHQLRQVQIERGRYEVNRFGNLLYDIQFITERPVFGWSPWHATRGDDASNLASSQGNGMSGFALRYGAVGIVAFFTSILFAFRSYSKSLMLSVAACVVVALALMGEQFLNFPAFLTLMFLKTKPQ